MKKISFLIVMLALLGLNEAIAQWNTNGNNIYNTNSGFVGIGSSTPATLLHVAKNMTEPTITIQNLEGSGGATYSMVDNFNGADWKFKATQNGGFKIRDHANGLDVFFIEQNSSANLLYLKSGGRIGVGTSEPHNSALMDMSSTDKGFLPPRMTRSELNNVSNPANGLVVFCSDCGSNGSGALAIFMTGEWYTLTANCLNPLSPSANTHVSSTTQIVWNWNLVSEATGYKWNTVNNYATASDMGTATTWTETDLTCGTSYTRYAWAYNTCGYSTSVVLTQSTSNCPWTCGNTIIVNHLLGTVAPVTKTVTYGTVTNIPGEASKCWITSNLGSDHQATADNDATEASAGWYWQFNKQQGYKHTGSARTPNTTWIASINENSDWLTANDPCALELGNGWRLPTLTEWTNVDGIGAWDNSSDTFTSLLKLHEAGSLHQSSGSLVNRGARGSYFSSTQSNNTSCGSLYFSDTFCYPAGIDKANAFSLRCIKD